MKKREGGKHLKMSEGKEATRVWIRGKNNEEPGGGRKKQTESKKKNEPL